MKKNKPLRIIIDTNLWISFIISDKLKVLDKQILNNNVKILFSTELIDEIRETIQKPKLRKYFKGENIFEEMFTAFDTYIDLINVKSEVTICRDAKDNFLLSLAKDGKADYLITGDKDLLVLNSFEKAQIVSLIDYIKFYKT